MYTCKKIENILVKQNVITNKLFIYSTALKSYIIQQTTDNLRQTGILPATKK